MKKTTLALSIITAFGLWGCVGSSSSDDQPIDQGNSQQQRGKLINPSDNSNDNNNNDNGNSGNAGSTGGAGGATGHISGGAGGQPIADDDSSDDDKTGGNDNNDNDNNDNGSDAIPTVAEAKATLDKISKELTEKTVAKSFLDAELTAMKGVNQAAQQALQTAKDKQDYTNDAAKEAAIAAAQAKADKAAAAEAEAQAKVDAAENEITKLTTEEEVARTGVEISQAKEDFEPQSKIDALRAQQASTKADAAKTAANKIKSAADAALTAIKGKVSNKEQEVADAQRKYDSDMTLDNQNALIKVQEELATLKAQQAEAQKKATDAENDYDAKNEKATQATAELATAKELDKKRAVASTFSTPADREVFADIAKAEKSDTGIWTITFKDGTPLVINPVEINNNPDLYLGNGPQEYTARILPKGDGKYVVARVYDDSLYGYSDDKFFAVGDVTDVTTPLSGTANYTGNAVLQSADNSTNLISQLSAKADFSNKVLTGNFSAFKSYKPAEVVQSKNGGPLTPYTELPNPVLFTATINGNRFEAAKAPGQANVYGYFYGDQAGEMGGLVQHEKFHGAFGAKKPAKKP